MSLEVVSMAVRLLEGLEAEGWESSEELLNRLADKVRDRLQEEGAEPAEPAETYVTEGQMVEMLAAEKREELVRTLNLARWVWRLQPSNSRGVINIYKDGGGLSSELSNMADREFEWFGMKFASIESALQSMKYDRRCKRAIVADLPGMEAKKYAKPDWSGRGRGTLYLPTGKTVHRESAEYQKVLADLYETAFLQCPRFMMALALSGSMRLEHSIGRTDIWETILTADEFITQLERLRKKYFEEVA